MIKLHVLPNYYAGHTYYWEVDPGFTDPGPWAFVVQSVDTGKQDTEDWADLSEPIIDMFSFSDEFKVVHTKDFNIMYRVVMTTPNGTYTSPTTGPYSQLPRKDFLIAREIMRKEMLDMREWGGVPTSIWKKTLSSDPCDKCLHPVTKQIIDPDCAYCGGSGLIEGWHGPYQTMAKFSPRKSNKTIDELVTTDIQTFSVRILAYPFLIRNDILVDMTSDKRYSIEKVESAFEVRRIPIIYDLMVAELPPSDSAYKLGSGYGPGEERCQQ